jgi:HK97 family phage portal protein
VRSVFGPVRNATPVPLTTRHTGLFGIALPRDTDAQLATTGKVGILWQIIDRLGTSVATPDWHLYRKAASGRKEDRTEVTTHAALDLLNKPNAFYTRPELIESAQQPVDLIGEGILLITRIAGPKSLPLELWPVNPARMEPVPHPVDFIEHWWYHSPDGVRIRIENDDVLRIKRPNPRDPFRGMGPVQSLLADIDGARYSAEWNRNFFINGAEPGGIIEVPDGLSDDAFDTMTSRWRQQHQGVANAHRVAIIEHGKWVDRKASMKDLQIAELRGIPDEQIRKAFGYPVSELGDRDVNRATAWAGKATFAENLIVPRLNRWRHLFNTRLLPMYAGGQGLEFDYDNPVPPDAEAQNAERDSKVAAAVALLATDRFQAAAVLEALELPQIEEIAREVDAAGGPDAWAALAQKIYLGVGAPVMTRDEARSIMESAGVPLDPNAFPDEDVLDGEVVDPEVGELELVEPLEIEARARRARRARAARIVADAGTDLAEVQRQWEAALDRLLDQWGDVTAAQRDQLLAQVFTVVDEGDLAGLAALEADSDDGAGILAVAMLNLAIRAAKQQADEASKQGVSVAPPKFDEEEFEPGARAAAGLLAVGLASAAGREALRLATPGVSAREVAEQVESFIDDLTDRTLRDQLGGQLTAAQNQGRIATLEAAPAADYYATEELDSNTCPPCRGIDGRRFATLEEARTEYANGGYRRCDGRERCRGTVVAVWEES